MSIPKHITLSDIQFFVATHNRADLLKTTLESLLSQTAGIPQITALDFASVKDMAQQLFKLDASKQQFGLKNKKNNFNGNMLE